MLSSLDVDLISFMRLIMPDISMDFVSERSVRTNSMVFVSGSAVAKQGLKETVPSLGIDRLVEEFAN